MPLSSSSPPASVAKTLFAALVLPWTLSAHAAWTEVPGAPGLRKYMDWDSVHRSGAVVRTTELIDASSGLALSGERVFSIRWVNEYHCERKQTRVVFYEAFSEPMGRGQVKVTGVDLADWADTPEGSLASKVWSLLCRAKQGFHGAAYPTSP